MTRNQAILAALLKSIENVQDRLNPSDLYENTFIKLRQAIQNSLKVSHRSSYFEKNEVVKCLMKIINAIGREIEMLEIEMRGIGSYSGYENIRLNEMILKQSIKDELTAMLNLIIQARPEIRNTELSDIVKMLA